MTYSFGEAVESTPESARWYKLTPAVIEQLRVMYPADSGIRDMLARASSGLAFMGVAADDLYWLTATTNGNIGGVYKDPIGPVMTYEQVLRVFEPVARVPDTKPVFRRNAVVRRNNTGLYIGLGVGIAALLGVAYMATKKKAAAPLAANRRRLRRNAIEFSNETRALAQKVYGR